MYNTNREGKSILSRVFKDYSEMETCKELLNIFVEENWIDVFKQSEYFSQYMEPKKGNSVIPQTTLSKIIKNNGKIPETVARKVKKRGVLIVRHTIPSETIHQWMADLG